MQLLYVISFFLYTMSSFAYYIQCWLEPPHRVFVDRYADGYSPVSAPDAASTSAPLSPSAFPPTSCLFQLPRHPYIHLPRPSVLPRSDCLLPGRPPCWVGPEMAAGRTVLARTWGRRWSCRGASRWGTARRRPERWEGWRRCWGKGSSLPGTGRWRRMGTGRRTGILLVWQGRSLLWCQRSQRARSQR